MAAVCVYGWGDLKSSTFEGASWCRGPRTWIHTDPGVGSGCLGIITYLPISSELKDPGEVPGNLTKIIAPSS